jgi:hypothetical protein
MKELILATHWKVKEKNGIRSIQLFDQDGNKVNGDAAKWKGSFICSNSRLDSLKGAPRDIEENFDCEHNRLGTLKGSPRKIGGSFFCDNNRLETLKGSPRKIGGSFFCNNNSITSMKGFPKKIGRGFYCNGNKVISTKSSLLNNGLKSFYFSFKGYSYES